MSFDTCGTPSLAIVANMKNGTSKAFWVDSLLLFCCLVDAIPTFFCRLVTRRQHVRVMMWWDSNWLFVTGAASGCSNEVETQAGKAQAVVLEKGGREVWVQSEREFFFQETTWSEIQSFFGWKNDRQSTHESRFERCERATFFWHRQARWKGQQKVSATIWCGVVRQSNSFFYLLALRWSYAVLSWQRFVSLCEEKLPKVKGAE